MSAADISAIPQANAINNQNYRAPYRGIIRILPNLVNILNTTNPNVTPELRAAKFERIRAIIDSNLTIIAVAMGSVPDADPAYQNIPDSGPLPT